MIDVAPDVPPLAAGAQAEEGVSTHKLGALDHSTLDTTLSRSGLAVPPVLAVRDVTEMEVTVDDACR